MGADDATPDPAPEPSLEPPSLFGRRRKNPSSDVQPAAAPAVDAGDTRVFAETEAGFVDAGSDADGRGPTRRRRPGRHGQR